MANQTAANQAYKDNAAAANQYGMARMEFAVNKGLKELENALQLGQMRLEGRLEASAELSKQQAGRWAQYIQAAAEINASDMSLENKTAQIAALKQQLIEGINHTTDFYGATFGNIGLAGEVLDWSSAALVLTPIADAVDDAADSGDAGDGGDTSDDPLSGIIPGSAYDTW
jgi:hypothetical protein